MDFYAIFAVDIGRAVKMCSFCLLTSIELIHTPNHSLLYFHSNDINRLEILSLKKNYSYKCNCYTNHIKSVCAWGGGGGGGDVYS